MRSVLLFVSAALGAFIATAAVCPILARRGVLDRPNARSSHLRPTVRGAGLSIVLVILCGLGVRSAQAPFWMGVFAAVVLLAIVSFADDVYGVGARTRFLVHAAAASAAMVLILRDADFPVLSWPVAGFTVVAWLWIVGYTNAFNFMDGINGLAAVQAVLGACATVLIGSRVGLSPNHDVAVLSLVTAGAACGFLPYNFPSARAFMGDVSSATLGFILSVFAVIAANEIGATLLVWLALAHANFVLDTTITLGRRMLRGDPVGQPHREHFYQRLVCAGQSHARVTLTQGALQVCAIGGLCWAAEGSWLVQWLVGSAIITMWLGYFWYAEKCFRRAEARKTPPISPTI